MLSILTTLLSLLKVLFVSRRLTQVSEPFPQRFPVCTWRVTPDFQVAVYSLRKSLRRNFQLPSCSRLQQWQLCQQINRTVPFKTISWFRPPFQFCFSLKGNGFKFFHTTALKTLLDRRQPSIHKGPKGKWPNLRQTKRRITGPGFS